MKRKQIPKKLKEIVWDKYIGKEFNISKCICCNYTEISKENHDCGHVKAVLRGGSNEIENLRPICESCNSSMGAMNMFDFKNLYYPISKDRYIMALIVCKKLSDKVLKTKIKKKLDISEKELIGRVVRIKNLYKEDIKHENKELLMKLLNF